MTDKLIAPPATTPNPHISGNKKIVEKINQKVIG